MWVVPCKSGSLAVTPIVCASSETSLIMLLLIYLSYITHNTEKPTVIHTDRPADVEEAGTLSELCPEGHVSSSPGFVPETELDPRQRRDRESL